MSGMFLAGQVIVKTEHLDQLNAPGRLHAVARCVREIAKAVVSRSYFPRGDA